MLIQCSVIVFPGVIKFRTRVGPYVGSVPYKFHQILCSGLREVENVFYKDR